MQAQKQNVIAELWEVYEARWKQFASASDTDGLAGFSQVPFPVTGSDASTLLDVLLYGAKVCMNLLWGFKLTCTGTTHGAGRLICKANVG